MAREMKDSGIPWIGEIPSDWDVSTLGKFISIDSGISVGKKYEPETPLVEVPYLRVANVQGDHLDLSDVATIWVTPEEAKKYRLKPGQLLMTEGGDRDKLGRGCLWNGEIEGCIHQNHVFAVQTDNRLLVRYLDYLTTSEVARIYFDVTAKKTTNLACTSKSTIQKFVIPVPTVGEQRVISKYLDRKCAEIDAVLEKTYASIEEYYLSEAKQAQNDISRLSVKYKLYEKAVIQDHPEIEKRRSEATSSADAEKQITLQLIEKFVADSIKSLRGMPK